MKKGLSIKILLLVASIFSQQLANAYCMYSNETANPIKILVFKNKNDYNRTLIAKTIMGAAQKLGAAAANAANKQEVAVAIPLVGNLINMMLTAIYKKAEHNILKNRPACWNWNDILRDHFSGAGSQDSTRLFFVAFNTKNNSFIGSGLFPIGGYVKIHIDSEGKGAIGVYWTMRDGVEKLYYKTDNYHPFY